MKRATLLWIWALAAALPAAAQTSEDFTWRGRLPAGQILEIKGVNGSVEAQAASGSDIEVRAVKRGQKSDPREVRIDVIQHGDGVTLCAVYPSPDASKPNECAPGSGGRMNTRNNDVSVEFTVALPAGVRFVGRTVNGRVGARGLASDVAAYTVNGSIEISTSGFATAHTVNGSIDASLGNATWNGTMEFKTVNGSINLKLPPGANADLDAETVNGEISTDFPLTIRGRFSKNRISGTIGGGGRQLVLKSVNGGLRLRTGS